MADKKYRTNWSDKTRRITGGVTLLVIILLILLAVFLGKGKKTQIAEPQSTAVVTPVVKEEVKTEPAPAAEVKVPEKPVVEEPVGEIVEAIAEPEIVEEERVVFPSGSNSFEVCGVHVENTWSDGLFVSTSLEKDRFSPEDVMEFVRYEAEKYKGYLAKDIVLKITASVGTIKIEHPASIDPALLMPYYQKDIEEYASKLAPTVVEEPVVEEVVAEESPVEEVLPETYDFTVFGYTVNNSWLPGKFTSTTEKKGLVSEGDVRGFAEYEVNKYGDLLVKNTAISFVPDGFSLTYPESVDVMGTIPTYKSDLEEYILTLFAKTEEETAKAEEIVREEVLPETYDFSVFGYTVNNSWLSGKFTSTTEKKGLVSEGDVRGFAEYEVNKYGDLLVKNTAISFVPDGFVLSYPESVDVKETIPTYKSDLEEYILSLFAETEEETAKAEEKAREESVAEVLPETYDFTVFGYTVNNSWLPGKFTSTTEKKGLVSEGDVRGFAEYEVNKYGDLLVKNTAISFVPDGFSLTYPESVDVKETVPTYKSDLEEYILSLFAETEEETAKAEEIAREEVLPETYDFSVFGYTVNNSWLPGKFTSTTEKKGIVSEGDVRGFAEYEVNKYGDLLVKNTAISFIPDGFVLSYPESVDVKETIPTYKSDLEEYILSLFAETEEETSKAEEKATEESVVEVLPETYDFSVFGYTVNNSWLPGKFTSTTEKKGLVSEGDVRGFAEYEVNKYGDLLVKNTAISFVPDGFVLSYPESVDVMETIPTYKSDLEEYILSLFAKTEEETIGKEEATSEEISTEISAETPQEETVIPRVPEPVTDIMVTVITDKVKIVLPEGSKSPVAEKLSSFSLSLSIGADFGFRDGRSFNPTIFPSFAVAGEFRNIIRLGDFEIGARFDGSFVLRPVDGTFQGKEMDYYLNNRNWAADATASALLMLSYNWNTTRAYLGFGVGYSVASNIDSITSHTGSPVFGFKSGIVATGVAGIQWNLGDSFFLGLEGQGRYFIQSGEYAVGTSVRMGWSF